MNFPLGSYRDPQEIEVLFTQGHWPGATVIEMSTQRERTSHCPACAVCPPRGCTTQTSQPLCCDQRRRGHVSVLTKQALSVQPRLDCTCRCCGRRHCEVHAARSRAHLCKNCRAFWQRILVTVKDRLLYPSLPVSVAG